MLCLSKCLSIWLQIICSIILHDTEVKDTGLLFSARCQSPFFENRSSVSITPIERKKDYCNIALNRYDISSINVFKRMLGIPPGPIALLILIFLVFSKLLSGRCLNFMVDI